MKEKNEMGYKKKVKQTKYIDAEVNRLEQNGFSRKDITCGPIKTDIISLLIALLLIIPMYGVYRWTGNCFEFGGFDISEILLAEASFFLLAVVHKWLHGCSMAVFAEGKFGSVMSVEVRRSFITRCICVEPLAIYQYVVSALTPMLVLGVIPAIFAIMHGSDFLFLISAVMIVGSASDVFYACKLIVYKTKNKECLFFVHPYQYGYLVLEKDCI